MCWSRAQILTIALLVLINGIVLRNSLLHDPWMGYDSPQHIAYIRVLSEGRMPTPDDTAQFFSAPLPYIVPAIVCRLSGSLALAARAALIQNFFASLVLIFSLVILARRLRPDEEYLPPLALGILAVLPVYYKSFAFVRGAPLLAMFAILSLLEIANLISALTSANRQSSEWTGIRLGLYASGMALSRQWGVFALVGMFGALWGILLVARRGELIQPVLRATLVVMMLAGTYYVSHSLRHDSLRAFNREPAAAFAFSNQPAKFYLGAGGGKLFTKPMRPSFSNQFLPIFYSEIWGDYWMYFNVYGIDTHSGKLRSPKALTLKHGVEGWVETNRGAATLRAARANVVGLPLTVLMVVSGVVACMRVFRPGFKSFWQSTAIKLRAQFIESITGAIIIVSLLGYFWFLITYPNESKGDTIKATYMLHLFPLLALLSASIILQSAHRIQFIKIAIAGYLSLMLALIYPQFFSAHTKTVCLRERPKHESTVLGLSKRSDSIDPALDSALDPMENCDFYDSASTNEVD